MLLLLTFFIYTIIMWLAGNCIAQLYFTAIQKGQVFDELFGWQDMLADLYASEKKWKNYLGKALGDCQICFAFWFMPFWYMLYVSMGTTLGIWAIKGIGWNIAWYFIFHSIGAIFGLLFIIKRQKK